MLHTNALRRISQSRMILTLSTNPAHLPSEKQEMGVLILDILQLLKKHFALDVSVCLKKATPDKADFIFWTSGAPYDNINRLNLKALDFLASFSPVVTIDKQLSSFWMNTIATVQCAQLIEIYNKLVALDRHPHHMVAKM